MKDTITLEAGSTQPDIPQSFWDAYQIKVPKREHQLKNRGTIGLSEFQFKALESKQGVCYIDLDKMIYMIIPIDILKGYFERKTEAKNGSAVYQYDAKTIYAQKLVPIHPIALN